jgi:beta-galactosidase
MFLLSLFSLTAAAQRTRTNFDENWKFHLGHASDPAQDFNFKVATIFSKAGKSERTAIDVRFNDAGWRTLNLPHDWAVELPFRQSPASDLTSHGYKPVGGLFPESSIGWYRKHFTVARADSGKRTVITFDGIFRDSRVWINGFYLGNNESGYIGVSYDLTDFLNYDKDNVIVVRADASQYEGWFYEGAGIYRHVWLNQYRNVHVDENGLYVHADVTGKNAVVNIETTVKNESPGAGTYSVSAYIADREGRKLGQTVEQKIELGVNGKQTVKQKISLLNAHLWSPEDPYRYHVVAVVKSGATVLDTKKDRFGVRTFRFDGQQGFFLNGRHMKIHGTNNHQDHAGVGSALPDYLQYYRINLLKEMGVNAYRTSHNPPTPELLDACDSLGMLVLDETRLLNSGPEYMSQFERMILRDRNHPSVFLWSIGNEEGYVQTTPTGKRIAQTLLAKQKELDPSRTSTYAADMPNVYKGINEVIPVRGFNYRQFAVADYHRDHPNQPILGTEMGSTVTTRGIYAKDSINAYVPDQDITAPSWASKAEDWWKLAADNAYWMGGFVWTGFDYRGEPTPYRWPNVNSHFGIMDVCGFPKNIYYYYQSWWTDKDVLHISPHWNWKGKEGQPIDVWVNTNADNVELFLNGKSLGKKVMPRNSHLQWSVPYEPGTLEAVAYKKGKKLSSKVETTAEPYEVVVTPYRTTILADGKDAVVVNISAVDRQGREVPDANNLISFSFTGDAKFIGVGNGDPSSHEPDRFISDTATWQRRLFNGHAQVIIQAGKKPDIIKFEAKSAGLQTGSTGIHTIQPGSPTPVASAGTKTKNAEIGKMIGADISFLPQNEARGTKYSDNGVEKDAIQILADHGINYIRLRIFNNPAAPGGYSRQGFCDLENTKKMAKRIKAAGLKFLLDFHYSDTWADPEKQFKPSAWKDLPFNLLRDSVERYTKNVLLALKDQGTLPDMVQIGNEINHGILWPDGHIGHLDSLAQLIDAGIKGTKAVGDIPVMLHVALGGQHDECKFFFDNMIRRGIRFDVIGLSYYPKWHATLADLRDNMLRLANTYPQDIIVVEYSQLKREVNETVFSLPGNKGRGSAIWEPLSSWEAVFDRQGKSNEYLKQFDEISQKFMPAAAGNK